MLIDAMKGQRFILASASPRRQALLAMLNVPFEVMIPDIDEVIDHSLSLEDAAIDLARQKAEAISVNEAWILGCDTIVEVNAMRLGKPVDKEDAATMLNLLSGQSHRVMTGCCLRRADHQVTFHQSAIVTFATMDQDEISEYIASQEPFGKAGAYAIQGYAAKFITKISGDYYAIMGLPVRALYKHLKELF